MKSFLRNCVKQCYYTAYPFLGAVWFVLKYVEIFLLYPCMTALPFRLSWRIFRLRAPWLFLRPSQKRGILNNMLNALETTMPRDQTVLLARRHALFLSSIRFDTQFILSCPSSKVDNTVRFEGLSHLDAALEKGQGVMLLGCHAGYFYRTIFAAARETARRDIRLHVINIRPEYARRGIWKDTAEYLLYQKLVKGMEEEPNLEIEYIGGSLEGVFRGLRMGEIVAANVDVPVAQGGRRTVQIEFLGRQCFFSTQLIRLSRRVNAVCLPFVTRVEGNLCWVKIYPSWMRPDNETFGCPEAEEETRYVFRILEEHILAYPEQWWLWNDLGGFASSLWEKEDCRLLKDV